MQCHERMQLILHVFLPICSTFSLNYKLCKRNIQYWIEKKLCVESYVTTLYAHDQQHIYILYKIHTECAYKDFVNIPSYVLSYAQFMHHTEPSSHIIPAVINDIAIRSTFEHAKYRMWCIVLCPHSDQFWCAQLVVIPRPYRHTQTQSQLQQNHAGFPCRSTFCCQRCNVCVCVVDTIRERSNGHMLVEKVFRLRIRLAR